MKQSKRLLPICDFKRREEEAAAKNLASVAQEMAQQKQRLMDLENYRGEYDHQFLTISHQGISAKRMKEHHVFMHNLAAVLEQQKAAILVLEKDYEDKKWQWISAKNRNKAINKVQMNYQKQEQLIEEKKQQKEQDDRGKRLRPL